MAKTTFTTFNNGTKNAQAIIDGQESIVTEIAQRLDLHAGGSGAAEKGFRHGYFLSHYSNKPTGTGREGG